MANIKVDKVYVQEEPLPTEIYEFVQIIVISERVFGKQIVGEKLKTPIEEFIEKEHDAIKASMQNLRLHGVCKRIRSQDRHYEQTILDCSGVKRENKKMVPLNTF